uniref:Lipocalin-like domain protein n=1 Tax=Pithovirus LCPAC101 TaxID=2506586 RepID=A0A481Z2P6_9VIRU|nr:MAG: lipocalin-like domain protein [Pithovirus LCPAC101]
MASAEIGGSIIGGGIAIAEPGVAISSSILDEAAILEPNIYDMSGGTQVHPIENNSKGSEYLGLDQKIYAGRWWEIASYPLNEKDTWGKIPDKFYKYDAGKQYARFSHKYIWMRNNKYFKMTDTNYLSTNNYSRIGTLVAPNKKIPRQMILKYDDNPEDYLYYDVIATDYIDYSIVKIRNNAYPDNEYRILILSRKKFISKNEARALIEYVNELGYDGDILEASKTVII